MLVFSHTFRHYKILSAQIFSFLFCCQQKLNCCHNFFVINIYNFFVFFVKKMLVTTVTTVTAVTTGSTVTTVPIVSYVPTVTTFTSVGMYVGW